MKKNLFTIIALLAMSMSAAMAKTITTKAEIYADVPFKMPEVTKPTFPNRSMSIVDFGAKNGGIELCTKAFNDAITAVSQKGGGTVEVPAGVWLTGPIVLQSNVNLHLDDNAIINFTEDFNEYPFIDAAFEGVITKRCQSPIMAHNAKNIAITGGGIIDGNGDTWRPVKQSKVTEGQWKALLKKSKALDSKGTVWYPTEGALKASTLVSNSTQKEQKPWNPADYSAAELDAMKAFFRPTMVNLWECNGILLEGVTFKNSPLWCLHLLCSENIFVDGISVITPQYGQNGDAIDVESCKNVVIINSTFDAGDDAICMKSGRDEEGRKRGMPTQNVVIRNNTVFHGHGGFVVGSEMSGGVRNVLITDCKFNGTDAGLKFKSARGRGGLIENIWMRNISMLDIAGAAVTIDMYYTGKLPEGSPIPKVDETTPTIRNIQIDNINCRGCKQAFYLNGLPENKLSGVKVKNFTVTKADKGIYIDYTNGLEMENVTVKSVKDDLVVNDAANIIINGKRIK